MDWLRRHIARPPLMVVDLTDIHRIVQVVGESHHQGELFAANGGYMSPEEDKDPSLHAEPDSVAELLAEPNNPYDDQAVAVRINGRAVGYLARGDAAIYQPLILKIEGAGHHAICLSRIVGGYVLEDGSRAYFGAELFLSAPDAEGLLPGPAKPVQETLHDWSRRRVDAADILIRKARGH